MAEKTVTADELLFQFRKKYGEAIGGRDFKLPEPGRIPTGVWPFDIASGGGFPKGRITLVTGKESSLKTGLVLRGIAHYQRLHPDGTAVFVDFEGSTTSEWAAKMGVDTKRWIYLQPEYAEQGVDMFIAYLYASDVGFLAADSIAAMTTMQELKSTAEQATPGTQSRLVGEFVRKSVTGLLSVRSEGRMPVVVWVNQLRFKIGVMFGNPETVPGGEAQKYAAGLRVRLYGKNVEDKSVSKTMPVRKHVTGVIQKWKVPIIGTHFEYDMAMLPHDGMKVGECDDLHMQLGHLKDTGILEKTPKSVKLGPPINVEFPTLKALAAWLRTDEGTDLARAEVIRRLQAVQSAQPADPETPEDEAEGAA